MLLAGDEIGGGDVEDDDGPIVLVHGLGGSRHVWDDMLAHLPPGRRVVRLELRGHGESGGPRDLAAYTVPAAAADLAETVVARSLQGATIVAHSLGGTVALWAGLRYPERFSRFVLVNTGTCGAGPSVVKYARYQIRQFRKLGPERTWEARTPVREADAFLGDRFRTDSAFVDARRTEALAVVPEAFEGFITDVVTRAPFRPWLWQLQHPVELLAADGDSMMYPEMQQLVDVIPRATLTVLKGCGHNTMMEQPEEFADVLAGVLAAAPPQRRQP